MEVQVLMTCFSKRPWASAVKRALILNGCMTTACAYELDRGLAWFDWSDLRFV
jgi:hypothetical protein